MIHQILQFQREQRPLRSYSAFADSCAREEHRACFASSLKKLVCGNNRANGFDCVYFSSVDENRKEEYWRFDAGTDERIVLIATNCCVCGEYKYTQSHVYDEELDVWYVMIPLRILCWCKD